MAGAGGGACVPVGPRDVPDGFEAQPGVWGFHAIAPWGVCAVGRRSALGQRSCKLVDDCRAAFPPPGAIVVRDQAALRAALDTAAPGATIALDDGTYEPIVVDRDVNLVGRCAANVFIRGSGAQGNGIAVDGPHAITVRSVTIRDVRFGIWAGSGASVTVERSLFTDDKAAAWIVHDAKLKLRDSLVSAPALSMADGVLVGYGGHAELVDAELRSMHVALQAFGPGSTATGAELVISGDSSEERSAHVIASRGGRVEVDRSLVFAPESFVGGAQATDPRDPGSVPATLRFSSSELLRVLPTNAGGFDISGGSTLELVNDTVGTRARVAISAELSANISLKRTVIRTVLPTDAADRGVGAGIVINDGVRLSLEDSAILGMAQSAVLASRGCQIRMSGSLIADVWEFERVDLGKRMGSGQAISLSGNAVLEMSDSTLQNNAGASIWMDRGGPSVKVERSAILDTRDPSGSNAVAGLVAWSGTVDVRRSLVHGIPGTAMAFGDVTGAVSDTVLSQSDVAFRWMGASRLVTSSDEARRPEPSEIISRNNVLVDTGAAEAEEPLPLGDCRCEDKGRKIR
jgi:hypothetical protein